MAYLIDSNVFLRRVANSDPVRPTTMEALKILRANQEDICFTSQVLAEFWTVCTRPATVRGGYGLSPLQTEQKAKIIERFFRLLPDSLAVHQAWRQLISAQSVLGVEIHDARLVATMQVHQIPHLLTSNVRDIHSLSKHHSHRDAGRNRNRVSSNAGSAAQAKRPNLI